MTVVSVKDRHTWHFVEKGGNGNWAIIVCVIVLYPCWENKIVFLYATFPMLHFIWYAYEMLNFVIVKYFQMNNFQYYIYKKLFFHFPIHSVPQFHANLK